MTHETRNYVPRFVLDVDTPGDLTITDRRTGTTTLVERDSKAIVSALFALGATVIEIDVAGMALAYAEALKDWGGITVVCVRNGHTV